MWATAALGVQPSELFFFALESLLQLLPVQEHLPPVAGVQDSFASLVVVDEANWKFVFSPGRVEPPIFPEMPNEFDRRLHSPFGV